MAPLKARLPVPSGTPRDLPKAGGFFGPFVRGRPSSECTARVPRFPPVASSSLADKAPVGQLRISDRVDIGRGIPTCRAAPCDDHLQADRQSLPSNQWWATAAGEPFVNQSVVLGTTGLCAVRAQIAVASRECRDGTARRLVLPILGERSTERSAGREPSHNGHKTEITVLLGGIRTAEHRQVLEVAISAGLSV